MRPIPAADSIAAIPARSVRLLDLLAAIDSAILRGELHAARSWVAEAVKLGRGQMQGDGAAAAEPE